MLDLFSSMMASICNETDPLSFNNWRNEADALIMHYLQNSNGRLKIRFPDSNSEDGIDAIDMLDYWQKLRISKDNDFPLRNAN